MIQIIKCFRIVLTSELRFLGQFCVKPTPYPYVNVLFSAYNHCFDCKTADYKVFNT